MELASSWPIGRILERDVPINGSVILSIEASGAIRQSSSLNAPSVGSWEQAYEHVVNVLQPEVAPLEAGLKARDQWHRAGSDVYQIDAAREALDRHVRSAFPGETRSLLGRWTLQPDRLELRGKIVHVQVGFVIFAVRRDVDVEKRQFRLLKPGDIM